MEQAQRPPLTELKVIYFEYNGKMASGKSQMKTAFVHGRVMKFPNKIFKKWRADFQSQIFAQRFGKRLPLPFTGPVRLRVSYYPGDRIRRDLTGILDALFHAAEVRNGGCIVEDDSQFKEIHITEVTLDRERPHCVFDVMALEQDAANV